MQPYLPSEAPTIMYHPTKNEEPQIQIDKKRPTCTGRYLEKTASFTITAPQIMSPQHSLILTGIMMMTEPAGGGMFDNIGRGLGFLSIMAGIPLLVIKPAVAIPLTAAGALGTAVVAPIYAGEVTVRKTISGIKSIFGMVTAPSKANVQRRKYMTKFVARMHEMLKEVPTYQKGEFQQNPALLVSLSITVVAFLSRNLDDKELRVGGEIVRREDLNNANPKVVDYFKRLCTIKSCIRDLNLSPDNEHAWEFFTNYIKNHGSEENQLTEFEKNTLDYFVEQNEELSRLVCDDELFQQIWTESLN